MLIEDELHNCDEHIDYEHDNEKLRYKLLELIEKNYELKTQLEQSIKERLELLKLLKDVGISK
jgi:hypothetical protein